MQPDIRYVRSADGTKIATASMGSGPPLILPFQIPVGTIEMNWALEELQEFRMLGTLASRFTLVTYEPRGQGISEREVEDLSLEARVADMKAVFDGLGIDAGNLLARGWSGPQAIAFAARYPDYVQRMVLWGAYVRGRQDGMVLMPEMRTLAALIDVNWTFYWQAQSVLYYGFTEKAQRVAEMNARSSTPDQFKRAWAAMRAYDAGSDLPNVRCPTLVIYPENTDASWSEGIAASKAPDRRAGQQEIASTIPGARLRKSNLASFVSDEQGADVEVIMDFLSEGMATDTPAVVPSGTTVILFADIADSTGQTERSGDAAFRQWARDLDGALRVVIRECGGAAIDGKLLGDGVLATFPSAREAIDAARRCAAAGDERSLPLHLGIHAGDVIREDNNVYGGAVNVASRISALSAPGEILVSDIVRGLARTSAGVGFDDRGEHLLKGISDPQRIFAVRPA